MNIHTMVRASLLTITFICISIGFLFLAYPPIYFVHPGETALHLRLGRIVRQQREPGFYFKAPYLDHIISFNIRIQKADIETDTLSKDLQSVSVGMVINYQLTDTQSLYNDIGTEFEAIIINPFVQESVKAVVAQFNAENLIQKRHEAKEKVITELRNRLEPHYIKLIDFNFTHLDFSSEFIKAVEDKQIAEQSAKRARNLTEKVKEEAQQARERAEAEAYALRIKREAVTPELIDLQKVEIQIKAIERWDGKLPHYVNGPIPMMPVLTNHATPQ